MKRGPVEIRIGLGSCGIASGGEAVRDALVKAGATVKTVGCNGMCYREPLVEVVEADGRVATYGNVTPEMARGIVRRHDRQAEAPNAT
jgi:(2Fe-2S) ferredoxin